MFCLRNKKQKTVLKTTDVKLKGERLNLKRRGSEAFAKVEKKAPPSQPGLEPGSLAYAIDALPLELLGPAHVQISSVTPSHHFASASQHKPYHKAHLTISAPTGPSRRHCASCTDKVKNFLNRRKGERLIWKEREVVRWCYWTDLDVCRSQ